MAETSSLGHDLDDEGDVPPLEDMSELIDQVNKLRDEVSPQRSSPEIEEKQVNRFAASSSKEQKSTQMGKTFGGFKKGFLNNPKAGRGKPSPSSRSLRKDDIPVIKAKNPMETKSGRQIPEVQEAMKSSTPSLENKEWISEDLLKKIEANPSLAKLLTDPKFTVALSKVQADPMKAMAMLNSNPEMQKALQEFSTILGDHFTALGHSSTGASTVAQGNIGLTESSTCAPQCPVPPSPEDEAKMHEILSDPEVMKVLQDHHIQKLLSLMKTNSDAAQLEAKNATADTKAKIQKLVDVGLLGFSH